MGKRRFRPLDRNEGQSFQGQRAVLCAVCPACFTSQAGGRCYPHAHRGSPWFPLACFPSLDDHLSLGATGDATTWGTARGPEGNPLAGRWALPTVPQGTLGLPTPCPLPGRAR